MPRLQGPYLARGTLARLRQSDLTAHEIVLRAWRPTDAAAVVAAYGDPDIRRWHCRSMTDTEARDWIDSWSTRWREESGCGWAVSATDGSVLGQISLRAVSLSEGTAEVSYWILPAARGRGTARHALRTMTTWAFSELRLHRIEINHSTRNPASCRVADAAGYTAEGIKRSQALHTDGWHDMHQHARIATDRPMPCRRG